MNSPIKRCPGTQLRIAVHGAWGGAPPVAIQIRGLPRAFTFGSALAAVDGAWPEHYYWALRAHERGDTYVTPTGAVWFFEGAAGEALALGE